MWIRHVSIYDSTKNHENFCNQPTNRMTTGIIKWITQSILVSEHLINPLSKDPTGFTGDMNNGIQCMYSYTYIVRIIHIYTWYLNIITQSSTSSADD